MAIEQTASPPTIESRVSADGVRYTWTEFMDYYDNADIAAELWETAQDVAPYEPAQTLASPRFEPGSIVRVVADRTPGVHPMHAEGILVALQKAKVIAPEVVKKKSVWCRQLMQQVRKLSHLNFISSFPLPLFLSLSIAPSLSLSLFLTLSISFLYFFLLILSLSLSEPQTRTHTR